MANIKFPRKEFEKALGTKITKDIEEKINMLGTPLENLTSQEIEIEIFPNRPDLLSMQRYVQALKTFIGLQKSTKKIKIVSPQKNYKVTIDKSVKQVRPHTVCAVVKNLKLTEEKIIDLVNFQEKLHSTLGRNRKKVAIGIYPLEKIKLPIRYEARKPSEIKFIPLESKREMNAQQILRSHPKGKQYSSLLKGQSKYPVFIDANNKILSMPPIINSQETGKITTDTKEIFVECSGNDVQTLSKTLNILIATLVEMNGQIYSMKINDDKTTITPNLETQEIKVSLENINKTLGLELKESQLHSLFSKMEHSYNSNKKTVNVPAWRTDILHEVDLIEDIAIAYGYQNFIPELPEVCTIGEESKISKLQAKISETLIGLQMLETSSYHLIKKEEAKKAKLKNKIELEDSKTDYKILRPNLLIPTLRTLSENVDTDYPQNIFEIGRVFSKGSKVNSETRIKENDKLIVAITPGNFTEIKQILDYLVSHLGLEYSLQETEKVGFIEGRTGKISLKETKEEIGYLGEVHPETLRKWHLKMPLAILEINLDKIYDKI